MGKRLQKKPKFIFSFHNYFKQIKLCFTKPSFYSGQIPPLTSFKDGLIFGLINIILASVINSVFEMFYYRNPVIGFLAITDIAFLVPFSIVILLGLSALLYILAKVLQGQTNFSLAFCSVCYCTTALIFSGLPILRPISLILLIYLLIRNFNVINKYSAAKAVINILVPLLFISLFLNILGIFSSLVLMNATLDIYHYLQKYLPFKLS